MRFLNQEEYGPFTEEDVIPLAPTDEEREVAKRALLAKRERARAAKSAKKALKKSARREKSVAAAAAAATSASTSSSSSGALHASGSAHPSLGDEANEGHAERGKGKREGEVQESAEHAARIEHKKNKRRKRAERGAAAVTGGASAGPDSARLAGAAAEAVQKNKESSAVYASLFGKKDVSNEHLFIATAGHRYNLG